MKAMNMFEVDYDMALLELDTAEKMCDSAAEFVNLCAANSEIYRRLRDEAEADYQDYHFLSQEDSEYYIKQAYAAELKYRRAVAMALQVDKEFELAGLELAAAKVRVEIARQKLNIAYMDINL